MTQSRLDHNYMSCIVTESSSGSLLTVLSVFDSSTLTYIELEHAQSKRHVALLGVADQKAIFATLVAGKTCLFFFSGFDM